MDVFPFVFILEVDRGYTRTGEGRGWAPREIRLERGENEVFGRRREVQNEVKQNMEVRENYIGQGEEGE